MGPRSLLARYWLVELVVGALLVGGCGRSGPLEIPSTQAIGPADAYVAEAVPPMPTTYRLGMIGHVTTTNYWAFGDSAATVWNSYVLAPTKPSLYATTYPGVELNANLAATTALPHPVNRDDGWRVSVPLRRDVSWSDGEPITAYDIVFTYETVRDLQLGGGWLHSYPVADPAQPQKLGLRTVRALDEFTVEFEFNEQPGLPIWPHAVGVAPIMPRHYWSHLVTAAAVTADPRAALYAYEGAGEPSGGPMTVSAAESGSYVQSDANVRFHRANQLVESGGISFRSGPFVDSALFSFYSEQESALLALKAGEIDFILNPLGMPRGFIAQVESDASLTAIENPSNGFRYLGFNLRRSPMNIDEFRDALALVIDKEFMANDVLQGAATPLYTSIPEANHRWYNAAVAEELAAPFVGKSTENRLLEAVALLEAAGFTWDERPAMDPTGVAVRAGSGIRLHGEPVRPLEILAPGPGYDPMRATYAVWIETWLEQLGFEAEANPTDFNTLVTSVYLPNAEGELDFDLYLLGWSLGDPSLPNHYEEFWSTRHDSLTAKGNNTTGFSDPEFDGLVDMFNATTDSSEAYELIWKMERIIAREKPYIILFDTGIVEFYRSSALEYPFTNTVGGLQNLQGMQGLVRRMK
jgi:ABC-type transport system substrate-binding protein